MHQQLMMAQKIVASGAGSPPNTYGNLQMWISARELSTLYSSRNDSAPQSTDGGPINRFDTISPTTRCVVDPSLSDQQVLELAEINGNNVSRFVFNSVGSAPEIFTKPASGVDPTAGVLRTAIKAAGAGTFIFAGRVNAAAGNSGINSCSKILSGSGGEWGIEFYESSGLIYFRHYNFDGNYDEIVSAGVTPGAPVVVSFRHNSSQIRVRVNGGSFSNAASGNTQDFGSSVPVMAFRNGDSVETMDIVAYNASRSDAELLEVEKWLGAKLGITI